MVVLNELKIIYLYQEIIFVKLNNHFVEIKYEYIISRIKILFIKIR